MSNLAYQTNHQDVADDCQPFDQIMADAVRVVRRSAEGLTPKESQLLSDVQRGRGLRVISEASDIARYRCRNPADAAAIGEGVSRYILTGHPGLNLPMFDTLRYEGATNTMADDALIEHILNPTRATAERVIEAHVAQMVASKAVVHLMYQERGRSSMRQVR